MSEGVSPTDFGFTDQRTEVGLGLMDYHARYYDPYLGRFISPDTIVPEPESSSGLNRYRYARNNPLKYTDPSGHCVGLALGMDTAFCVAVGKIAVDIAVVAIATYLIVDSTQEIGQTINDLPLNQVNPPVTSGGYEAGGLEFNDPLYHPGPTLGGEYTGPLHLPYPGQVQENNSSILDPFERPANWPTELAATDSSGNVASVRWKGFSKGKLSEHYDKHVMQQGEFGDITQSEYLRRAKGFAGEMGNFNETTIGNFVIKHDPSTGRVFIGHIKSREIRSFYIDDGRSPDPFQEAIDFAKELINQ